MKTFSDTFRVSFWLSCCAAFAAISPRAFAVGNLTARAISSTEVQLTWDVSGLNVQPYSLARAGIDGKSHVLANVYGTSFSDRALEPDATYTYFVTSTDSVSHRSETITASVHLPGWQEQDVGLVGVSGSARRTGEIIAVTGAGADIWGTADAFHFAHQPWTGDGVMIVRVDGVENTAPWAKAGIMFRESLAPGSRYVMAAVNPAGDAAFLARTTTDGPSDFAISYSAQPHWLKLSRHGNVFETAQSGDGNVWTVMGSVTLDLPATLYAGLAVSSHAEGVPCTALFDEFNLSPTFDQNRAPVKGVIFAAQSTYIDFSWNYAPPYTVMEYSRDNFQTTDTQFSYNPGIGTLRFLDPGTTYYVRVRTVLDAGLGLSSPTYVITTLPAPANAIPAAPTSLSANAVSSSQVNLMWADNADNETGYYIETSLDGINYSSILSSGGGSAGANYTTAPMTGLKPDTKYFFRVRAMRWPIDREGYISAPSDVVTATTSLTPAGAPFNLDQPASTSATLGGFAKLSAKADGATGTQWMQNGLTVPDGTASDYQFMSLQPAQAGIYRVVFSSVGGAVTSDPAIVGLTMFQKTGGAAREVGSDIHHPNGNIYDQVLLTGSAAAIRADAAQVTRLSYVDLNDDIVQVEFSGAGTLTITLDNASGPAPAAKYNQPDVNYMKGHATIVIAGADETTNVAIFSVGLETALNQSLFRSGESYDGVADVATLAILSRNGRFGGIFGGDAHFFAVRGYTGIFAPNVEFDGGVTVSDITASDNATPVLLFSQAREVRIAGGSLAQSNQQPVQVGMFSRVQFIDGTASSGRPLPAQTIQGRLDQNGRDVTTTMTSSATP